MKVFAVALALSVSLAAAPSFAQTPAPAAPRPAQPAAAAPAAPQRPFPDGAKYGFVVVQRIASESKEGLAATQKIDALRQQKLNELNEKNKAIQAAQQKLDQGGSVLNDAARAQLTSDIDRQQRDLQRLSEDAQQDVNNLQQQLQVEFERRLLPVFAKVAQDKKIEMLFSSMDSGLLWADPALDLTTEVIRQLDAAPAAAAPAK